ncbi:hypothetical protein VOLCADRAFT_94587 [Volvox carteri f. nagariensis]|uniref:Uncharacterized protein n=1 Tax=Volvox carteri f. nagariensis TaxID=3068 RepID=D8U567_VOLCA|nr:uncharacterized protein VOLCADRAFT_94587 [Volvox carteri f. nagariensis]EFJ45095.1 hypothetical protein VOLCADRAFT_94587 [Volvox carteri f. nagariensis]|eukprot:XP_002953771.1 hypothetical protein VOLCADRAFT_94587 [Volvox carteri f. nagariensis]
MFVADGIDAYQVSTSDYDGSTAVLTTAGSLPLPETNAAGDRGDALLKGLSSPAFHNTLASQGKPGPKVRIGAASITSSPAVTAAATAAFTLSMGTSMGVSAHALVDHATVGCSQVDAHGVRFGPGTQPRASGPCVTAHTGGGGCSLTFAAAAHAAAGDGGWPSLPCWQASPCAAIAATATPTVVTLPPRRPIPLSTKRGLYEGTVRGGSARNTWMYITARTPPG